MKSLLLIAVLFAASVPTLAAAEPPPAQDPVLIPPYLKPGLVVDFEGNISQALGAPFIIRSMRTYTEQDGSMTTCVVGSLHHRTLKLAWGNGIHALPATKAQWAEVGCNRPNYLLMR